tara:strand:+ start:107 stop:1375 length:1269 start_codon:yes stop_codon:yes gene_type:complete
MLFKITKDEGLDYSKISKDKNKIHIDNLVGYNSIFGEKICHGTLVISKIFKKKEFRKIILSEKIFNIYIEFLNFIEYDKNLLIKKVRNKFYVIQNKKIKINITIQKKNIFHINRLNKKKINYFKKKLINLKSRYDLILKLLANISSYVGNRYPGKYSLINSININFNNDYLGNKKNLTLSSYKLNKRLPLIKNILLYEKFKIEFETLERPFVKKNKFFIKNDIRKKIKDFKDNILIIGGSSGIGNDIFNIFKINKKILKIVTFNKNIIKQKNKNTFFYQIDVLESLKKIKEIIKKHGPVKIFYFPTTKISFDKKVNNDKLKEYKKIFITIPLKIIRNNKDQIISIFYPSTTNIDEDKKSDYSKVKRLAEISLKKLCKKKKIIYKSVRFPALNSKQSISLLNPIQQTFFEYINKYPKLFKKIF